MATAVATSSHPHRKRSSDARAGSPAARRAPAVASRSKKPRTTTTTTTAVDAPRHARRHADAVEPAKRIWNQLRIKTNTPEEIQECMAQLMPLIRGKAPQVALQHDGSRCVQACVQFGTAAERQELLAEFLAAGLPDLAKNQYACFAVLKLIKYCHNEPQSTHKLLKAFQGHVAKLSVHAVASRVMDALFTHLTPKQTATLRQEFYGPHFALFAATDNNDETKSPNLMTCLAKAPHKKEQTLDFLRNIIHKGMAKTLYGLRYFQELCAEYIAAVNPTEIRQMATTAADHSIHLLSSKQGTRVVAALVAYGTAKDRKRILKSLKGYTRAGLTHPDTYLAILRLVQLTDDTVSIQKNLLNELLVLPEKASIEKHTMPARQDETKESPLLELALHKNASKLLLLLLMPAGTARDKVLDPYETSVLFPNPMIAEDGKEVPTSRKDPEVRRRELLEFIKDPIIELCQQHANELLRSVSGSLVLREVYGTWRPEGLVAAVVEASQASLEATSDQAETVNLFDDKVAHHSLRNLLQADVLAEESPLGSAFVERFSNRIARITSSSRGAFVLAALCKVPAVRKDAIALVKNSIKTIKQQQKKAENKAGYEALLKEIS